jgi:hypothetical protein
VHTLPFSRPLTRADLEDLPEDGHRYELIDGVLIVSLGPQLPHQDMGAPYVEVARADGDEVCEVVRPFPLRMVPQDLLD